MRYCPLTQVGLNNAWISRVRVSTVSTDKYKPSGFELRVCFTDRRASRGRGFIMYFNACVRRLMFC